MKMIHDFKEYDRLIGTILIAFGIFFAALLVFDGFNSSLQLKVMYTGRYNFSALRYACILYYVNNEKFPESLEDLIKKKYAKDINWEEKHIQYNYKNEGKTFQLSVVGFKRFNVVVVDLKHDNKVNQIFIHIIMEMKDKNLVRIETRDNINFQLLFPKNTPPDKQEEIERIVTQIEKSINKSRDDKIKLEPGFLSNAI